MMKKISIVGSTGSIGVNTLRVVEHLSEQFEVVGLAAKSNIELLIKQAKAFRPKIVAIYDEEKVYELKQALPECEVLTGIEGVNAVASHPDIELSVSAITGTLGLQPAMAAIEAGKDLALANKEALVSGGELVIEAVKRKGVKLLPIDSEHSAIFQCLEGEEREKINRVILTASGGPFRQKTIDQLQAITPDQALAHPTWQMGSKVTIDSSTLMNKGLEVIEAHWLFSIPVNQIEVVVHPQSIIHSMVEFADYSIMAQMGIPSMITPIQYALTYPHRQPGLLTPFNFLENSKLEFFTPDYKKFQCLALAFDAIHEGGSLPCFMNAANEVLVYRFLNKEISWIDIGGKLEKLMQSHQNKKVTSVEEVLYFDKVARHSATTI